MKYTIRRLSDQKVFENATITTSKFMTYAFDEDGQEIGGNHGFIPNMEREDFEIISPYKIALDLTENEISFLKTIAENIRTQNPAGTRDPYFVVYELKEIVINEDFSTPTLRKNEWQKSWTAYKPHEDWDGEWLTEEDLKEWWEDNEDQDVKTPAPFELTDYESIEMAYVDDFVGAFLTRESAENYIERDKHNLNQPYIYVQSFYKNPEMQLLIKILSQIK